MDQLDLQAKPHLTTNKKLNLANIKLVKQINKLSAGGSPLQAPIVITSGLLTQVADNIEQTVRAAEQYLGAFNVFQGSIDLNSPCYLPEYANDLTEKMVKQQAMVKKIKALEGQQLEDTSAVLAVLGVVNQAATNVIYSASLEVYKLCLLVEDGDRAAQIARLTELQSNSEINIVRTECNKRDIFGP